MASSAYSPVDDGSSAQLRACLDSRDLSELDKAVAFEKAPAYKRLLLATGALAGAATGGLSCLFAPLATCRPGVLYDELSVEVSVCEEGGGG